MTAGVLASRRSNVRGKFNGRNVGADGGQVIGKQVNSLAAFTLGPKLMWLTEIHKIDLNLLAVFHAIYSERNITRAGEALGLTQSGVSHSLRRLRQLFGDELFVRNAHGMNPTSRAKELAGPVREALDACLNIVAPMSQFDATTAEATFRISMSDYEDYLLTPILATCLRDASPSVSIEISDLKPRTALPALEAGDIDLVLAPFPHIPSDFSRRPLFTDELVVIARQDHPDLSGELTIEHLTSLPNLRVHLHQEGETLAERVLSQHGLSLSYAMTSPHFMVAPHIVAECNMIAVVRKHSLRASGSLPLAVFPMPLPTRPFTIWAVWHHRLDGNPAIAWLVDTLAKTAPAASRHENQALEGW